MTTRNNPFAIRSDSPALSDRKILEEAHASHKAKLQAIRPVVDTRPPPDYRHLRVNKKKQQLVYEQNARIQRANLLLVDKMRSILKPKATDGYGGQPQTRTVPTRTKTLHAGAREKANERIARENERILQRIINTQPVYSTDEWQREAKYQRERKENACRHRTSEYTPRGGSGASGACISHEQDAVGREGLGDDHAQSTRSVLKALGSHGFTPRPMSSNIPVLPPIHGASTGLGTSRSASGADTDLYESGEPSAGTSARFGPVPIHTSRSSHSNYPSPRQSARGNTSQVLTGAGSWKTLSQADPVMPYPVTRSPRRGTALDRPTGIVEAQWQYHQAMRDYHDPKNKSVSQPPKPMLTLSASALPLGSLTTEELLGETKLKMAPGRGPGPSIAQLRALFTKRPSPRQVLFEDDVDVSGRIVRLLVREYVEPSWLIELRAFDFASGRVFSLRVPVAQLKSVFLGVSSDDMKTGPSSTPAARLFDPASRNELVDHLIRCCRFVIKVPPENGGHSKTHAHSHDDLHSGSHAHGHSHSRRSSHPQGQLVMCLDLEPQSGTSANSHSEHTSESHDAQVEADEAKVSRSSVDSGATDDNSIEPQPENAPANRQVDTVTTTQTTPEEPQATEASSQVAVAPVPNETPETNQPNQQVKPFYFVDETPQEPLNESKDGVQEPPMSTRSSLTQPPQMLPTPQNGQFTVFTPKTHTGVVAPWKSESTTTAQSTQTDAQTHTQGNSDGKQENATYVPHSLGDVPEETKQANERRTSSSQPPLSVPSRRSSNRNLQVNVEDDAVQGSMARTATAGAVQSSNTTQPTTHSATMVSTGTDPMTPAASAQLASPTVQRTHPPRQSLTTQQAIVLHTTEPPPQFKPTHSLSVQISCRSLPRARATARPCNPCVQVYARNLSGDWYPTGQRTERLEQDLDPDFTTLLQLEFNPKVQTEFAFSVFDVENPEDAVRARLSPLEAQRAAERAKLLGPGPTSEVIGSVAVSVNDLLETKGRPLGVRLVDASGHELANAGQALLIIMTRTLSYDE